MLPGPEEITQALHQATLHLNLPLTVLGFHDFCGHRGDAVRGKDLDAVRARPLLLTSPGMRLPHLSKTYVDAQFERFAQEFFHSKASSERDIVRSVSWRFLNGRR